MKFSEYKSNIIAKYSDEQQGKMMYRHHKLFDISKTIVECLSWDVGYSSGLFAKVDTLLQNLPREYVEKYDTQYNYDIIEKNKNIENMASYKDSSLIYHIKKLLGKNKIKYLQHLKIIPENITLTIKDNDIAIDTYKGIKRVLIADHIFKELYPATAASYNPWFDIILGPFSCTQDDLNHEYQHAINGRIMPEKRGTVNEFIKNEYLAQMTLENNRNNFIHNIFTLQRDGYINKYLSLLQKEGYDNVDRKRLYYYQPLHKYLEQFSAEDMKVMQQDSLANEHFEHHDHFFSINGDGKPEPIDSESGAGKRLKILLDKIKIADTTTVGLFHALQDIVYPKYFNNYQQFLTVLAITPLSQWKNLLEYYKRLKSN